MKTLLKFKALIDEKGINADLVREIIDAHKSDHARMRKLYARYKADPEGPTIFNRQAINHEDFETGGNPAVMRVDDKVNNRLNNAFDADIVDTKIGYMLGHPISYDFDDKQGTVQQLLEEFLLRNNSEDTDAEYGKMAAICGYGARLAYVDPEGKERIKNIDPWEVVLIGDDIHEPDYSLRYYTIDDKQYAEFYDDTNISFFETSNAGKFTAGKEKPHMFEFNPLFGLANNAELKGDAEKVLALIDAYDRTLSDASNEIEQYRLAYLILRGMGADDETLANLRKSGVFELLGENDDVKYLTKDINDQMIENHLDRLEENILRFAKSVNFTDESFGTEMSGVAMRFKLMALENKCVVMERKFVSSLRYQFKVLFSAWAKRNTISQDDYLKVFYSFKRNLPVNLLEEAQIQAQIRGLVSERTRLGLFSQVDDVEYELEQMKEDAVALGNVLEPLTDEIEQADASEEEEAAASEKENTIPCPVCGGSGKVPSAKTGDQIQCTSCKGTGVRKR